jgi:hypothetical protein
MEPSTPLAYDEFLSRVQELAEEHGIWTDDSDIALPALARAEPPDGGLTLLTFLHAYQGSLLPLNHEIYMPYACMQVSPGGGLVLLETAPPGARDMAVGYRFTGPAALAEPDDREAFVLTYYELLTAPDGPLYKPWDKLPAETIQDLHELFNTFAPVQFLPLYRRYAKDFVKLVGALA